MGVRGATVVLTGGGPWGFRLCGGDQQPLRVSKIRKRSKAECGGLAEGDVLVSVNGQSVDGLSHTEAMERIDGAGNTLSLAVNGGSAAVVEIPVVMQTSLTAQSAPDTADMIFEQSMSRVMPGGTRITVTSSENVTSRSDASPRFAEENKRAMRERYAISNVFVDNTKPTTDSGPKVRSEENLRSWSNSRDRPLFSSMVTAQINRVNDKENISPQPEPKLKPIPTFNARNIAGQMSVQDTAGGSEMHRSMDDGLYSQGQGLKRGKGHVPVFGPPVQISLKQQTLNGISSSDPSITIKKLFSDSAFYDDARDSYPTIDEQMRLCRAISRSLTAAANKKARGARMFAKRQKRSSFWVHEGTHSGPSSEFSSEGNASSLDELHSEISVDEGGNKPLFQFRIPKIAQQVSPVDSDTKMSLSRSEFENLRLNKQRCEHNAVSPVTCFNLAADLQSHKGRGAQIFEKRRKCAEDWVVDDRNVKKANPPANKLQTMIENKPRGGTATPWDAAVNNQTFYTPPSYPSYQSHDVPGVKVPVDVAVVRTANLTAANQPCLLDGPKFNRTAKGWSSKETGVASQSVHAASLTSHNTPPAPPPKPQVRTRDYNSRPRAWQPTHPSEPDYPTTDNYNTYPRSRRNQQGPDVRVSHAPQTTYHSYPTDFMTVGTDL